jgi:hypothetical protein
MRRQLQILVSSFAFLVACSEGEEPAGSDRTEDAADGSAPEGGVDAPDAQSDAGPTDVATDVAPDVTPDDAPADAAPAGPGWDDRFALPGMQGTVVGAVRSIVVTSNRWLYVAGDFHHAGSVAARNVAVWNGVRWLAVGEGLPDAVTRLAVAPGDEIYAVTEKGLTSQLWHWNKTTWSEIGAADGVVRDLDVATGGALFVAGDFTKIGAVAAAKVARRVGTTWSPVTGVPIETVRTIRARGELPCIGGYGSSADYGLDAEVACHEGGKWVSRRANLRGGEIETLHFTASGELLIGGRFRTSASEEDEGSLARWDATAKRWILVGGGVSTVSSVSAIATRGARIYVCGSFFLAGGRVVRNVGMWDGTAWWDLEGGLGEAASAGIARPLGNTLAIDDGGELYVGGIFTRSGERNAMWIARWVETHWEPVDDPRATRLGINGSAATVVRGADGALYVGGDFEYLGRDLPATRVARFDGTTWSALGYGLDGSVTTLATKGNELWAVGSFSGSGVGAGGAPLIPARGVARWNGTRWSGVGGGIDGAGSAIAIGVDGRVWVGGSFGRAGATEAKSIATWDGTRWSGVGGGFSMTNPEQIAQVTAIVIDGGRTWVGGTFDRAGTVAAKNVAVWDGTTWAPAAGGFDGPVTAMALWKGKIVAAGPFLASGKTPIEHLAIWNGSDWSELAGGLSGTADQSATIVDVRPHREGFVISGLVERAGTVPVHHVAAWDGERWSDLGGGVDDVAGKHWIDDGALWVTGTFTSAGTVGSRGIARYVFPR